MLKPEELEAWEKPRRQEVNACLRRRREISPSLPLSPHCFSFPLLLSLLLFLFLLKWWPTLEDQSKGSNSKKEVRAVFLADSPQPAPCVYFLDREKAAAFSAASTLGTDPPPHVGGHRIENHIFALATGSEAHRFLQNEKGGRV